MHLLAALVYQAFIQVYLQVAFMEYRCSQGLLRLPGAPQDGSNACQEFPHTEGFSYVVVGAAVQGLDFVFFPIAHREHDYWHGTPGAHLFAYFIAVDARHCQIEHDQFGHFHRHFVETFFSGPGQLDVVAVSFKTNFQCMTNLGFIVDYKDFHLPSFDSCIGSDTLIMVPPPGLSRAVI